MESGDRGGFGRRRVGVGISHTLKKCNTDYADWSVKCVTRVTCDMELGVGS